MDSCAGKVFVLNGVQTEINSGKFFADTATFVKPLCYLPDALDVSAQLHADGGGVDVSYPGLPSVFHTNPEGVLNTMVLSTKNAAMPVAKSSEKSYKAEAARIGGSTNKNKILSIRFPKGVTCNNSQFNDDAEGQELQIFRATVTGTHRAFNDGHFLSEMPCAFCWFTVVVDGTKRRAEIYKEPCRQNDIESLMGGVKHLKLTTGSIKGLTDYEHARVVSSSRKLTISRSICLIPILPTAKHSLRKRRNLLKLSKP